MLAIVAYNMALSDYCTCIDQRFWQLCIVLYCIVLYCIVIVLGKAYTCANCFRLSYHHKALHLHTPHNEMMHKHCTLAHDVCVHLHVCVQVRACVYLHAGVCMHACV